MVASVAATELVFSVQRHVAPRPAGDAVVAADAARPSSRKMAEEPSPFTATTVCACEFADSAMSATPTANDALRKFFTVLLLVVSLVGWVSRTCASREAASRAEDSVCARTVKVGGIPSICKEGYQALRAVLRDYYFSSSWLLYLWVTAEFYCRVTVGCYCLG